MTALVVISIVIILLVIKSVYTNKKRWQEFSEKFSIAKTLVADGKYNEALEMLQKESVLKWRYKLKPEQRKEVAVLEIECLDKLNRIPEAVVSLANHLSAVYEIGEWPQDLLSKWISLYRSCDPIDIEKFYFCQVCGLHPETEALLEYAMERENCKPPINFPGKNGSAIIIQRGGEKYKPNANTV